VETQESKGIWTEYKDPVTGRSSLSGDINPKVVKTYCKKDEHVYKAVSSRELECANCGMGSKYNPGIHVLTPEGKLLKRLKKTPSIH